MRAAHRVAAALRYWKIAPEEMLVVHDDLDLPPGAARLKFDGGHGGQNGLRDIFAHLGHGQFHRLRLGIGHPGPGNRDRVTPWVLGRPSAADEQAILDAIAASFEVLPLIVEGEFEKAMHQLHTPGRESGTGETGNRCSRQGDFAVSPLPDVPIPVLGSRIHSWASNAASSDCRTSASRRSSMR